ncbi:hypothetical protein [Dichotomicrobium thermohalophilum]|uniref:Uncharacterized protein n=1 Tax=Dichotomicrobium thermohalophilum TaxID=933063 RepID=A0A397Q6T4_9HYPH|nr:hypothetical protein [Dichotomicrobium thermohalophilum]RIA55505.1 hypothetical protein BXY53_0571 [Dichotomicrobium thermohalophilum]
MTSDDSGNLPTDAELDQMLTDPGIRSKLGQILEANDIDTPLDDMTQETQRDVLRQVIHQQQQQAQASEVPEHLVDALLGDEKMRPALEQALQAAGIDKSLDEMEEDERRHYARQFIEALQQSQQNQ